jgi:type I site-specific restriction endonuclease
MACRRAAARSASLAMERFTSKTIAEFWQMIGRGTRLLEKNKIKAWCPEKDVFQVIDCWDNFDYFKLTPKGKEPKPQIPLWERWSSTATEISSSRKISGSG